MKATKTIRQMIDNALRAILVVTLVLATPPSAGAQSAKANASGPATTAKPQTTAKPAGGPQEGIKVHGHWVIEVRNPDGSLVKRHEFNNALSDLGGKQFLASLLSRSNNILAVGKWIVILEGTDSTGTPGVPLGRIFEPGLINPPGGSNFPFDSSNLVVPPIAPSGKSFTLTGSVTLPAGGTVNKVFTGVGACSFSPCNVTLQFLFTEATLGIPGAPPSAPVAAGQIVQVTVTFSFS